MPPRPRPAARPRPGPGRVAAPAFDSASAEAARPSPAGFSVRAESVGTVESVGMVESAGPAAARPSARTRRTTSRTTKRTTGGTRSRRGAVRRLGHMVVQGPQAAALALTRLAGLILFGSPVLFMRTVASTAGFAQAAVRPLSAHPRATQRGAIGGLFGGIGIFVVLSTTMTTTVLAAPVTATVTVPAPTPGAVVPQQITTTDPTVAPMPVRAALGAPAGSQYGKRGAKDGGKNASVEHGVISGLAANGIPSVALNAYRVAAARMASVAPGCGIPWYLLAGIGREESDHGRFGGAVLRADGVSTPAIIGPALDGIHWDFIPAPANGLALDGDAKYAHALGPMQFIPSTWANYGADANGDGKADIFNINDAALGAARYLCAAGGDLTTVKGQTRAVLAYNHNSQYLAQVLALANAYRKGITITGLPVGITSGKLPTLVDNGYIPPANPAAPTAAGKNKPCPVPAKAATSTKRSGSTPTAAKTTPAKTTASKSSPSATRKPKSTAAPSCSAPATTPSRAKATGTKSSSATKASPTKPAPTKPAPSKSSTPAKPAPSKSSSTPAKSSSRAPSSGSPTKSAANQSTGCTALEKSLKMCS